MIYSFDYTIFFCIKCNYRITLHIFLSFLIPVEGVHAIWLQRDFIMTNLFQRKVNLLIKWIFLAWGIVITIIMENSFF